MAAVGLIFTFVPWPGFPSDRCSSASDPYLSPWAFLRWLAYLAMAGAGVVIWRFKGRHDWRLAALAVLGLLALVNFPLLLSFFNALDCGL